MKFLCALELTVLKILCCSLFQKSDKFVVFLLYYAMCSLCAQELWNKQDYEIKNNKFYAFFKQAWKCNYSLYLLW